MPPPGRPTRLFPVQALIRPLCRCNCGTYHQHRQHHDAERIGGNSTYNHRYLQLLRADHARPHACPWDDDLTFRGIRRVDAPNLTLLRGEVQGCRTCRSQVPNPTVILANRTTLKAPNIGSDGPVSGPPWSTVQSSRETPGSRLPVNLTLMLRCCWRPTPAEHAQPRQTLGAEKFQVRITS